jgi:hypothetical protein
MLMPPYWNDQYYQELYDDVSSAVSHGFFDNGWMHYRMWGAREGRVDGGKLNEKDLLFQFRLKEAFARRKPSINCVIACWSGLRRDGFAPYEEDRTYYIKAQLKSLRKVAHQLNQITLVVPTNDEEPEEFTKFLEEIPRRIGTALVTVIRRDNFGQSYGSYSHIYGKYRDRFDYYLFIEDDYIFVQDNFDQELMVNFEGMLNCGFLCSLVLEDLQTPDIHAGIANGITSSAVLELIWKKYGELPHRNWDDAALDDKTKYNTGPQIQFSHGFLNVGKGLYDMTYKYQAPFLQMGLEDIKSLRIYAKHRDKILLAPVQYLEELELSEFKP